MGNRRSWAGWLVLCAAATIAGCLGEPPIQERWTLLELNATGPIDTDPFAQGAPSYNVQARVTYRQIFSGYLVAELRYSDSLTVNDVVLDPNEKDKNLDVARDVDRVLQNSVTAGRNARAVVGFDHLIQDADLSFTGFDPRGSSAGSGGSFFLLLYLAHGDEVERGGGLPDTLILDPVLSSQMEVLSTGLEISPPTP
jgi:hypothetical protein